MVEFIALSLSPIVIAVLAGLCCALPGNFLLASRRAMLGDAISHAVLFGIVAGYVLSGSSSGLTMGLGALGAAGLSGLWVEWIVRRGGVEPGAAMAAVFTTMFAGGVVLLELSGAGEVHLDVEHALYGNLESLVWLAGDAGYRSLIDPAALAALPPEVPRLALTALLLGAGVWLFWRPLLLTTFDRVLARSQGVPTGLVLGGLSGASALAAVAAFQAVGSILTISMMITPAASARLLAHDMRHQLALSLGFSSLAGVLGYVIAGYGPELLGLPFALSAAGMIATVSGGMLVLTVLLTSKSAQSRL